MWCPGALPRGTRIHPWSHRPTDRAIESSVAVRTIDEDDRFVDRSIDRSFASIESVDGRTHARASVVTHPIGRVINPSRHPRHR